MQKTHQYPKSNQVIVSAKVSFLTKDYRGILATSVSFEVKKSEGDKFVENVLKAAIIEEYIDVNLADSRGPHWMKESMRFTGVLTLTGEKAVYTDTKSRNNANFVKVVAILSDVLEPSSMEEIEIVGVISDEKTSDDGSIRQFELLPIGIKPYIGAIRHTS